MNTSTSSKASAFLVQQRLGAHAIRADRGGVDTNGLHGDRAALRDSARTSSALYKHVRGLHNAGQGQHMHLFGAPPVSGPGRRLRRSRRWSAHRPAASMRCPGDPCRIGNPESAQHIAPPRLGARPWRPGWGWGGCGPAPRVRKRVPIPRQPARQFRRLVVAPPPEPHRMQRHRHDQVAVSSSARPLRPSQRAKPGTRSSRSACFSARIGAAAVLVIGENGAGAVEGRRLWPGRRRSSVSPSSATRKGQAAAGASRAIQKRDRAPAVGAKARPRPPARGRRCRAAETADPEPLWRHLRAPCG